MLSKRLTATRDGMVQVRTYEEITLRLDAMAVLCGYRSRSELAEQYLLAGLDEDEQHIGRLRPPRGPARRNRQTPQFAALAPQAQEQVRELYQRVRELNAPSPA